MIGTFLPVLDGQLDRPRVALVAANLPTDDLNKPGRTFFEMSDGQWAIGFIGLEGAGPYRLLRSLVMLSSH